MSEGAGCVSTGGGVSVGGDGLVITAVEGTVGGGRGVRLSWEVDVGIGVFVANSSAIRVLVGVAVTAGFPGAHRIISNPTKPVPTRKNQSHRCLFIAKCHILCGFPS